MTVTTIKPGNQTVIPANAQLFQRAVANQIGVTAASSNNIGYLSTNRTRLEVVSQLTGQDSTNMFNFVYQNSGPVKFNVTNIDVTAPVRVQLLDGSGTRVLADNQGTNAQQQAYANLISSSGLNLTNGTYVVKVTYGAGGNKSQKQDYSLQISAGNTFTADYRTLASPTSIQNTLLAGGSLSYNSLASTAALLTSESQGGSIDIFGVLSLFSTNILA